MSELIEYDKFTACAVITNHDNGRTEIKCKLGLWNVDAPNLGQAVDEAKGYFLQYLSDGEYSSIIGGKTVTDNLAANKDK